MHERKSKSNCTGCPRILLRGGADGALGMDIQCKVGDTSNMQSGGGMVRAKTYDEMDFKLGGKT